MDLTVRNGRLSDLDRVWEIEKQAFPPAEAALRETYEYRLRNISDWFFVGELDGEIVSAVVGRLTTQDVFSDALYENVPLEEGPYFAILSVLTADEHRKKGFAEQVLNDSLEAAKEAGLRGATLACKDYLIAYYEKFGFEKVGVSESAHGGAVWNDMRFDFAKID